jgi:hypothetical protein
MRKRLDLSDLVLREDNAVTMPKTDWNLPQAPPVPKRLAGDAQVFHQVSGINEIGVTNPNRRQRFMSFSHGEVNDCQTASTSVTWGQSKTAITRRVPSRLTNLGDFWHRHQE